MNCSNLIVGKFSQNLCVLSMCAHSTFLNTDIFSDSLFVIYIFLSFLVLPDAECNLRPPHPHPSTNPPLPPRRLL